MSKYRLLLVEDNPKIQSANEEYLQLEGYEVCKAATLAEAYEHLAHSAPDLIILDIMMPDGSGLALCQELRSNYQNIPIMFLSALTENNDIVQGLQLGGDDYMTKPYTMEELSARCAVLLRRCQNANVITIGPLTLDVIAVQAFLDGHDILLTQKEFALLMLLTQNIGKVLSKEFLYESVWKQPFNNSGNAMYMQMSRLKKKLDRNQKIILSLSRGEGYQLDILQH